MSMTEAVIESLSIAADKAGDFTPEVYRRFYENSPGTEQLMAHIDELVKGKMMDEVYRLLMVDNLESEESYLQFEVNNHKFAYNVKPQMYADLLLAIQDTVMETLGDEWSDAFAQAWLERRTTLSRQLTHIDEAN